MKRAVITTTIYKPANLLEWAKHMRPGDIIAVSGDVNTPHSEVTETLKAMADLGINTSYTVDNTTLTSLAVPMRSIQRRNVAVLEAISMGADMITTVDTDNYPLNDLAHGSTDKLSHIDCIERLLHTPWTRDVIGSSTGWVNIGEWCDPPVTHRGWPIGYKHGVTSHAHGEQLTVGVHASLWSGDPDITALERLLSDPQVVSVPWASFALEPGIWCPFNSQATTYRRELFPLLNVWPGVGRMDDIWPSFVARHIMDHFNILFAFGAPNVRQERHQHDVVSDLEREIIGYRNTDSLLREIKAVDLTGATSVLDALARVFSALDKAQSLVDVIPEVTRNFWVAWISDLTALTA